MTVNTGTLYSEGDPLELLSSSVKMAPWILGTEGASQERCPELALLLQVPNGLTQQEAGEARKPIRGQHKGKG